MRLRCYLKEARGNRSLREVADAAGCATAGDLSRIETGRMLPPDEWIAPLEREYGKPLKQWYDWRGPMIVVEMEAAA